MQLRAAIATKGTEHIPRETFGVDTHKHVLFSFDLSLDQSDVRRFLSLFQNASVPIRHKISEGRRKFDFDETFDEFFPHNAIANKIFD